MPNRLITSFDPWRGKLCCCPPKYSLSPYTGCSHGCLYCYITSYIPRGHTLRLKPKLLERVRKEVLHIDKELCVSMANSSDPYPPEEEEHSLTREILKIFAKENIKTLLVTKSSLVTRDLDILSGMRVCVAITITTLDESLAKKLEPRAPSPKQRLRALKTLSDAGVPCVLRLDPVIPGLTDCEIEKIVGLAAESCCHVVSSTYKAKPDNLRRMAKAFPQLNLVELLRHGKRMNGYQYLPEKHRRGLMEKVRQACDKHGLTFATCREGFKDLHTATCDGQHLIQANAGQAVL